MYFAIMFNNTELSRSSFSPFTPTNLSRRSINTSSQTSRYLTRSNRLNNQTSRSFVPARVITENSQHSLVTYGLPLPVQVNEIVVATNERTSPISVHIDPSGWAWLVYERRLLVWHYQSSDKSKVVTFCKEFSLPATELHHNARLVCLVRASGVDSRQYGVLAVSPEGAVCYWPSMVYDSSPIETETELVGQEFHSLLEFQPHGYILTTTTNNILLLSFQKKSIVFHRFRQPGGVFSGFGRRMTSFIFGGADTSSTMLRQVVVERSSGSESLRCFYVLCGNNLYKWSVKSEGAGFIAEKLVNEWNVGDIFQQKTSQRFQVSLDKVKSFCIDAQESSYGISVLSAVFVQNSEMNESRMYYFLGSVDVKEDSETYGHFTAFVQLRFAEEYKEDLHQRLLDFHLCIPIESKHAFLYSDNIIVPFSIKTTDDVLNKVEFLNDDEFIFGSGYSGQDALFFVQKHGIVHVNAFDNTPSGNETVLQSPAVHQPSLTVAHEEDETDSGDNLMTLRTAFLQFCQGNKAEAHRMCDKQFEDVTELEYVKRLDLAVLSLSQEIIDDFPASDPRWAEAAPTDSGSSSASVIVIHQLEDKLKAHNYFLQFMKEVFIFEKLSTAQQLGRMVNTRHVLSSHGEKLKFAISLRQQHNKYRDPVDNAIDIVMKDRRYYSAPASLTQQDLFYREVSRVSDIISGLLECEKHQLSKQPREQDHREIVMAVNSVLENALQAACFYREENKELYNRISSLHQQLKVEFQPWTASSAPNGSRSLLLEQLEISCDRAFPLAEDPKTKAVLVQQLVNLSDIILDDYLTQLDSLRYLDDETRFREVNQKFEQDRHKVIYPLVSRGYLEEASSLAEKYRDFDILIEICETLEDQEKLQNYMNLFKTENFADVAFKWYMDRGQRSKLMSQPSTQHENLSKFLSSHDHLKWLHDIERNSFYKAFETLKELSENESLYLAKKKTLLSLAKLALLASDESDESETGDILQDLSNQQTLIIRQEEIPISVLQNASLDPVAMVPLTPEQLIELYISEINEHCNAADFKKALDILKISFTGETQQERYDTLKLRIWSQALLADDWSNVKTDDPIMVAKETVFYKTIQMAIHDGFVISSCLPPMESFLTCDDLVKSGLTENPTFQFLLRACYEQILRSQNDEMDVEI